MSSAGDALNKSCPDREFFAFWAILHFFLDFLDIFFMQGLFSLVSCIFCIFLHFRPFLAELLAFYALKRKTPTGAGEKFCVFLTFFFFLLPRFFNP